MMKILNIHTHHLPAVPGQAIVSVSPAEFTPQPGHYYSVGFHPWYLSDDSSEDWGTFNELIHHTQILAVGEAGLDKVTKVDFDTQKVAFKRQIILATEVCKPLIIHSVRSYNEIMECKKSLKPDNPWIIHGFRGKKELAKQLTDQGIYLSYGFKYNEEALRVTPPDMIFLETDEDRTDIHLLYKQVARNLCLSVDELTGRVQQNITAVFFNYPKKGH